MKFTYFSILAFSIFGILSCNKESMKSKNNNSETSESQGVQGEVRWLEGNMMPSYGEKKEVKDNKGKLIVREIYFCQPTKMNDLENNGSIFKGVESLLVKKTTSDKDGMYSINLPVGMYSVFTKEEEGFFANSFDGQGNINLVEVKEGEMTKMNIEINYKAAY